MQLIRAILSGWKIVGANNRILLLYYFANLLFAIVAAIPLYLLMHSDYNFRLAGGQFAGRFDLGLVLEFIFRNSDFLTGATLATAGIALIYTLLNIFFAGGVIAAFVAERKRFDAALFWGNCGYYFSTFFRLTLLSLPFYAIIALFVLPNLVSLATYLFSFIASDLGAMAKPVAALSSLLILTTTLAIFDYAKVNLVVTGERHILEAFGKSVRAFFKHFFLSWGFISAFAFLSFFIYLFYSFLSDFLQAPTIIALVALIVLQQILVISRLKLRLTYFASLVVLNPHLFLPASHHHFSETLTPSSKEKEMTEAVKSKT